MAGGPNAPRTSQSSSKGGKGSAKPKKKVTVHNEEFEANPLGDEDGCVGQLFHYLWRRNSLGQTCPGINIPDTVRASRRHSSARARQPWMATLHTVHPRNVV